MKKLSILLGVCLASVLVLIGYRSNRSDFGNVDTSKTNPQSQSQGPESSTGTSSEQPANTEQNGSVVYMTTDISSDGLMAVYETLSGRLLR